MQVLGGSWRGSISSNDTTSRLSDAVAALRPPPLPSSSSVVFDGAYVPSAGGGRVGGDWYEAFQRPDGVFGVSIGDVEGRGVNAALPMASLRAALFAFEQTCTYPVTSLAYLDAFAERSHPDLFATAFQGRYDRVSRRLWYANAGHPPPFIRRADGVLRRLASADVPVGVGRLFARTLYVDELQVGETLVAFTDGLSEMTPDIDEGERRIAAALADPAFALAPKRAAWLRSKLIKVRPKDDVAILTMHVVL